MTITLANGTVLPTQGTLNFQGTVKNTGSTVAFVSVLLRPLINGVPINDASNPSGQRQTQGMTVSVAPGATVSVTAIATVFATDPVGPITAQAELWAGLSAAAQAKTAFGATSAQLGMVNSPSSALFLPPKLNNDPNFTANGAAIQAAIVANSWPRVPSGLPRWFLYAVIDRESQFNELLATNFPNGRYTFGWGLTQLTGMEHDGVPYPDNLAVPDNNFPDWLSVELLTPSVPGPDPKLFTLVPGYMYMLMTQVSRLDNKLDIVQNIQRFLSGFAVPTHAAIKTAYGALVADPAEALRATAFHWNHGIFPMYKRDGSTDVSPVYLPQYDQYVAQYRPPVEADDGVWPG